MSGLLKVVIGRFFSCITQLTVILLIGSWTISSCSGGGVESADTDGAENSQVAPFDTIRILDIGVDLISASDALLDLDSTLIMATVFLVNKHNPGLCFGMPSPVADKFVSDVINANPKLAVFVRETFDVDSDFQVYHKIMQLFVTRVRILADGTFQYYLLSGRCCEITSLRGKLILENGNFLDTLLDSAVENVPC